MFYCKTETIFKTQWPIYSQYAQAAWAYAQNEALEYEFDQQGIMTCFESL